MDEVTGKRTQKNMKAVCGLLYKYAMPRRLISPKVILRFEFYYLNELYFYTTDYFISLFAIEISCEGE